MHESERIGTFLPLMKSLYNSARNELGFEPHAKICIIKSDENMNNPLGKTAHYSPSEHKVALYTQGRHIKDILRSLAHELVHHNQNCRGDFDIAGKTVQGYAQEDGHLREMEREAYECGNMIFRDWEDNLKEKGARPLFTSTTPYVQPMTTDVVGGRLVEDNKMKKKVNESNLREIIRGVIQEMFNDDLSEDTISDATKSMQARAAEVTSEGPWEVQPENKENKLMEKELGEMVDGHESDNESITEDSGEDEAWNDWKNEHSDDDHIKEMKNHLRALEHDRDYERKDAEYDRKDESMKKTLSEDSGEDQAWNDWKNEHADDDHIKELEHHLRALKEDRDYEEKGAEYDHDKYEDEGYDDDDDSNEEEMEVVELAETFFPKDRSIRQKARLELNEALMKRWTKIIK